MGTLWTFENFSESLLQGPKMKRRALLFTLHAAIVVALSACNTVKGVGQDIQKAGEAIEDAVKKK
jgi:predicted small secreted protein